MVWTNLGKQRMFEEFFCSGTVDDTFRLVLCASAGDWNADTSSTRDLTVVSSLANNLGTEGGSSGIVVVRDATADGFNFDVSSSEQLSLSAARAVLQTGEGLFQFSGPISSAKYIAMAAAGTLNSAFDFASGHEVYAWWDIGVETNISAGNKLAITDLSLQGQ
jgi:hypothetical protein